MSDLKKSSTCLYRGADGLKCAAGCLIADEEYSVKMEEKEWGHLVAMRMVPEEHRDLIQNLQDIHDSVPLNLWKESLREFAQEANLSTEVLDGNYPSNPATSNSSASIRPSC